MLTGLCIVRHQLNAKLKVMVDEFGKFKMGKLENVKVQIERLSEGEWEAEQEMTEAMEKVANLAAERGQARKQAMKEQAEARAAIREVQREKDQEEALAYEEEMQMMLEDLETMARALRKGEEMHRIALEEEQVRERARVEEVTRAELQVVLAQTPPLPAVFPCPRNKGEGLSASPADEADTGRPLRQRQGLQSTRRFVQGWVLFLPGHSGQRSR